MKIKLYKPYPGISEEKMTPIEINISGKLGEHIQLLFDKEYSEIPNGIDVAVNVFHCEKDNTYKKVFKKINLNYRFKFYHTHEYDDSSLAGIEGYTYLNFYKKMKIEWLFKRSWFQQNKNIKWFLGIIITCAFAFYKLFSSVIKN